MNTYHIIATRRTNSNTSEHGFGDYPTYTDFVACTVEADTIRKAQNKAKKLHPNRFMFGGSCGNECLTQAELSQRPSLRAAMEASTCTTN